MTEDNTGTILQSMVFPGVSLEQDMYFRLDDKARYFVAERVIRFRRKGKLWTDTYFNNFSVSSWKQRCAIGDVSFSLSGSGRFQVSLGLHQTGKSHVWLSRHEISLGDDAGNDTTQQIPLAWDDLESGTLYLEIKATAPGHITGGAYVTRTAPVNDVRIGAVITHFNRKAYVIPAVRRMHRELLSDPAYADRISLFVVDNSQNLTPEETEGATVIPSRNLGGSGGFTRGLLAVRDAGMFTHCLFMDDDATCEIDAFRRTIAQLQFARHDDLAMSGALLKEDEPWRLYEQGVRRSGDNFIPLCHGLDMRRFEDVQKADCSAVSGQVAYGAWWFFAFPLKHVQVWPFPFFVRGDDMLFGLLNRFRICTLNGVACWGEDFRFKEGPMTRYLAVRSRLLISLVDSEAGGFELMKFVLRTWFWPCVMSRNYESAEVVMLAIIHVMQGPGFWQDNIDMQTIRSIIGRMISTEKAVPMDPAQISSVLPPRQESETRLGRFIRRSTLNGLLIPAPLRRRGVVIEEKDFVASTVRTFRAEKILHYNHHNQTGYLTPIDSTRALNLLRQFMTLARRFAKDTPELRKTYRAGVADITTEAYWRDVFAPGEGAQEAAPAKAEHLSRQTA
ncbi:glycosyltransferase family 2 protein [Acetobacter sp. AN02]|uniref:glycosyltransferase n=1 Tax=Acetobacter sp. AN02 TaxID=2894186 RepID=UPI0024345F1A|nr:glycosyltransferase [Acetobacter sp. AN02]MDG6094274.1 glycosyltransferase family 2 protein [Acetobacter sp. AN02]